MTDICDRGPRADCDQTCNKCLNIALALANAISQNMTENQKLPKQKFCQICRQEHSGRCTAHSGDRRRGGYVYTNKSTYTK